MYSEETGMSIRNKPVFHKFVDYIVVPGIVIQVVAYCVLIYLSRSTLGIPVTAILLVLAALAMYLWTKPYWERRKAKDHNLGSTPIWQRIFCAALAVGAAIGVIGQFRAGVPLELTNGYTIFKLIFGMIGICLFTYIAFGRSFPNQGVENRNGT